MEGRAKCDPVLSVPFPLFQPPHLTLSVGVEGESKVSKDDASDDGAEAPGVNPDPEPGPTEETLIAAAHKEVRRLWQAVLCLPRHDRQRGRKTARQRDRVAEKGGGGAKERE